MGTFLRRFGLAAAVVTVVSFIGLTPAMADDTTPTPVATGTKTPSSTGPTGDKSSAPPKASPSDETPIPSEGASAPAEPTSAPSASKTPSALPSSSDATVGTSEVTDNGVVLTTIESSPNAGADVPAAASGVIVDHFEVSDITFSMVALVWDSTAGSPITLYARTHLTSGWSQWYVFATTGDEIIKADDGSLGTDAIWVGSSDALQVQAIGGAGSTISDLRAVVIDPSSGTTTLRPAPRSLSISNFLNAPTIVTRAQWGAAPQQSCDKLYDTTIIAVTIHHTAGSNDYTLAEAPSILRGIQAYHFSRDWCDIGYNFLIDKYGTIYEGRAGGMDLPVHGAHAGSANDQTVGVSFMMNSMTAQPTTAALTAAEQLVAWKLGSYYRNPSGTVNIAGKKLPIIFQHKDVSATECPGTYLSAKMDEIRQAVASIINSATASPIKAKWQSMGGAASFLGEPYRLEQPIGSGRYTMFQTGGIYWADSTGAHPVAGGIGDLYAANGGPTGTMGFPVTDEYINSNGVTEQDFQNSWVTWTATDGAVLHQGSKPAAGVSIAPIPSTSDKTGMFIYSILPAAQDTERQFGVPTSITIAQAILESGWGASDLARWGQAYFGIKCSASTSPYQAGCLDTSSLEYINGTATSVASAFRIYNSAADSLLDHGNFLRSNSRYAPAFATATADAFAQAIAAAGYATDPAYASKLIQLMTQYNLYQYDLVSGSYTTADGTAPVPTPFSTEYTKFGGASGVLGYAIGGAGTGPVSGSQMISFNKGAIFTNTSTGTHTLSGAIWNLYRSSKSIRSMLGLPTSDETNIKGGTYQAFQGGNIYWSAATGAHAMSSTYWAAYARVGSEGGILGYPTKDATNIKGGTYQAFQGGRIYWSWTTGTYVVC